MFFTYKDLAVKIMEKAKTHSCSSRSVYASNKKIFDKTEKIKLAGRSQTGVFAQILLMQRRKLHHRGLQLITPTSPDWINLKDTCRMATEFSNEFGLPIKDGYNEYLKIGIGMMKNFGFNKFKSMHSSICQVFESKQEIDSDPTPNQTTMLYELYLRKVNQKLGWESNDYKDNPIKYACFVKAKKDASKLKIDPKVFVDAQFAFFEWGDKTIMPDPFQLHGEKAIERVRKYCYENNITTAAKPKLNLNKIKNAKD